MAFSSIDLDAFLDAFDAVDVLVRLNGVKVKQIRGIWRERTEFVGQGEMLTVRHSVRVKSSDLASVTRAHTLEVGGVEYRQFGEPLPQNSGFSIVGLVK